MFTNLTPPVLSRNSDFECTSWYTWHLRECDVKQPLACLPLHSQPCLLSQKAAVVLPTAHMSM